MFYSNFFLLISRDIDRYRTCIHVYNIVVESFNFNYNNFKLIVSHRERRLKETVYNTIILFLLSSRGKQYNNNNIIQILRLRGVLFLRFYGLYV